ncbi:branched-chain amino acid ABC transporter permease [Hippea maritima]|uniref:ABC-type transporter, integral membrane subunit n=1 Tax=Hippea maritima (strain ATCC 700847 / DSM 10411 / MH2) TaxID=760142 RepID=F2LUI2_HIPMA|nr:branched-chain amino acid ABC transporter permease [Hippea maritima]AEA34572.1 ABC-type transporter, integral membrane subunit [Hippea maritima DSM 10411]
MFFQQVVNGLTIGGVYALIAMGLALVYGILRIIHVAHAGVYVVGAYTGLYVFMFSHSFVLAALASMIASAVVGVLIEELVYMPLLNNSPIISLIASIGVFISIEEGIRLVFGPYIKSFPSAMFSGEYHLGSLILSSSQVVVLLVGMISIVLIWFITQKTRFGLALKAVSEDIEMAEGVSIDSRWMIMLAFAFSSAFAGLAGLLVGAYFNSVYPSMGDVPAYKSLAIIVVGGMNNIWGAFFAAIVIGLLETIAIGVFNVPLPRDSLAFIFMVVMLLIKPSGIMGIFKR